MILTLDFTPQATAWIDAQARQRGLQPAEFILALVDERIPFENGIHTAPADPIPATVPSAQEIPRIDEESARAIAMLNRYAEEDATDDPEEIRKSEEEYEELKRNLNANRAITGNLPVFP